jgi:ferritin
MNEEINDIVSSKHFSSTMAESYADFIANKQKDEATKRANKIIKHVESKYKRKIKKAIEKDKHCHQVKISLPYFSRIKNKDVMNEVKNLVGNHFANLGFRTYIVQGETCHCLFDFLCNGTEFWIQMNW